MNTDWKIHPSYGSAYLDQDEYNARMSDLSTLRELGEVLPHERLAINALLKYGRKAKIELDDYLYNAPRREAQKFIGKKNIRSMIFKRDKVCLCCGTEEKLTLDHIVPVSQGGLNRISNLQTLCRSCNSSKGSSFKDYR